MSRGVTAHAELTELKGAVGKHSYAVEERRAFSEHLNQALSGDEYLATSGVLPLDPATNDLFSKCQDAIILCKLINLAVPDEIDFRAVNFPKPGRALNAWELKENANLAIGAAKGIGATIINIHAGDITNCVADSREVCVSLLACCFCSAF